MSSMENMGGVPEQPEDESVEHEEGARMENKGSVEYPETSPDEAVEMTRQRRVAHGLTETSDLTPEQIAEVNAEIDGLMDRLSEHEYDSFSLEVQDEWYAVEMEVAAGKDRELAKAVLNSFIRVLDGLRTRDVL